VARELGETHVRIDHAGGGEERRVEPAVAETAAKAGDGFALGVGVAAGDAAHALGGDVLGDRGLHLDADEVPWRLSGSGGVELEDGVSGRA